MSSLCGIDCAACELGGACAGCLETGGRPFGADCVLAPYCRAGEGALRAFQEQLIAAFNALQIPDMEEVTALNALRGSFINLEYTLPSGQTVKFWNDNGIYLGNQLHKRGSDRCYGIAADSAHLLVSEYGCGGSGAEVIVWKRWQ